MWDRLGSFGTLLGHVWYSYGTLWDINRRGQLTIHMPSSAQNPDNKKGTDPSRGVCPSKPIIAHMFVVVND